MTKSIKSMTGYGRGECLLHDRKFTVEIKSVNHRYCDISIRLPHIINPFEERIRKILSEVIKRGKIEVFIRMENFSKNDVRININTAVADAYADALNRLSKRYETTDGITLSLLALYPDLLSVDKTIDGETMQTEVWEALEASVREALASFNEMRIREGDALRKDISEKRLRVLELVEGITLRAPAVAVEYAARIRERTAEAAELLATAASDPQFNEARILLELALFNDRACIDEEITRLKSHFEQLDSILSGGSDGEAVGRKLDFLIQEIHRECNTIGSKSNDTALARLVIDLKSEVEKIREQVQNVE